MADKVGLSATGGGQSLADPVADGLAAFYTARRRLQSPAACFALLHGKAQNLPSEQVFQALLWSDPGRELNMGWQSGVFRAINRA